MEARGTVPGPTVRLHSETCFHAVFRKRCLPWFEGSQYRVGGGRAGAGRGWTFGTLASMQRQETESGPRSVF